MASKKWAEPAKISYFFGEGYGDLGRAIRTAWVKNLDGIKKAAMDLKDSWSGMGFYKAFCLTLFKLAILISIAVFGTLFTAVFTVVHIVILALFMSLVYIGFVILRAVDTVFCLVKGLSTNCYNPGCERKFIIPIYICPNCHAEHYHLVPSKYGIFKRTCNCGVKLPTTFINGRQKLESLCPHCHCHAIKGMHVSTLVPVIGGANSGKTCFISMAINQIEKEAPNLGLDYQYQFVQGDEYTENMNRMNSGYCPQKTSDRAFKYYNFYLTPKGEKINHLISVCDIAGEVFASQVDMDKQQGFRYADGLVVVIDPLSVSEYNKELKKTLSASEYAKLNSSAQPISDILSGLINTMESLYHVKATDTIKKSVAVVFTKCDIPGLDERIGNKAVDEYIRQNSNCNRYDAINNVCERFLIENSEANFINTLKGRFKDVQFFTCSALGHNETGKAFTPVNVELPLLWVIDKSDKAINLASLWGKKL